MAWGQRKVPRRHQMGSANRVRQLASREPVAARSFALDKKRGRYLSEEGETFLRVGLEPAAFELELDLGNQFAAPGRLDTSLIERSPCEAGVRGELMRDAAKSGAEPRLERRGRNRVADIQRKQGSRMFEIWLKIAQDNLVRLASYEAAVGLARLDLLDDLAVPLPHAQLHPVAPEVEIVRVEVDGFVGGRLASSLAHPLHNCRSAALFDGELDPGLTRH